MIYKILITITTLVLLACSSQEPNVSKKYYDLIVRDQNNYVELDTSRINDLAVDLVISGSTLQQQNKFAESILEFQQALKYDSSASILFAISKSYAPFSYCRAKIIRFAITGKKKKNCRLNEAAVAIMSLIALLR